jgi:hypothetical protein
MPSGEADQRRKGANDVHPPAREFAIQEALVAAGLGVALLPALGRTNPTDAHYAGSARPPSSDASMPSCAADPAADQPSTPLSPS